MPQSQDLNSLIPQIGTLILALTGLASALTAWLLKRSADKSKTVVTSTQSTYIEAMTAVSESFAKRIEDILEDKVDSECELLASIQLLETKSAEQSKRLEIVEEQLRTEQNEKNQLIEERRRLRRSVNSLNAKVAYLRRVIEDNGFKVSTSELARIEKEAADEGD